jgi:spermidine/putrescine transport system permease protein
VLGWSTPGCAMPSVSAAVGGGPAVPPPVASTRARRNWVPYALLLPGLLWLAMFYATPMVTLGSQSLQEGNVYDGYVLTGNVSVYGEALSQYWPQLVRSLGYAATATLLGLVLAYPLAYYMAQKAGRWKNIMLILVIAPFFTSFLIRTLAWRIILSDGGVVSDIANRTGLIRVFEALSLTTGGTLLNSPLAVIAGLTYNFLPFMILPLYAALERLDPRMLEAARDLYASGWATFRRVIWPLSLPGVVAGTLLTFIPATGDYINSRLLGNTQTVMIGQVIDSLFLRVLDFPQAAALSFILLLMIVTLVAVYVRRAGTEELV